MLMSKGQLLLLAMAGVLLNAARPAMAAKGPKHLEFYINIAVAQNNSKLVNPVRPVNAVQSGQPEVWQPNSFGIIHTFDSPLTSTPEYNATPIGRVQGWYGDVGQAELTLFLVATFTWADAKHNGTFSMLGVDIANAADKTVPIVGGTGHFAYARGIAHLTLYQQVQVINNETLSWFHYSVDFKY